jgi:lysophospholipase L1-like esterase
LIVERNQIGAKIMQENKVPIADFYGILVAKLDLAAGDRFHWTRPAYELLAQEAVIHITQALDIAGPSAPAAK